MRISMPASVVHEWQAGTAKAPPPIPGLDPGRPQLPNRPSTPQGGPPSGGVPGTPGANPGTATTQPGVLTPEQLRNIRTEIQNALRNGGAPTINIPPDFVRNAVPRGAVEISIAFFVVIGIVMIMRPFARAMARHIDAKSKAIELGAGNIAPQLEQLQQSVDAMAIELERITEAQRFQSKLLAGKAEEPARLPR